MLKAKRDAADHHHAAVLRKNRGNPIPQLGSSQQTGIHNVIGPTSVSYTHLMCIRDRGSPRRRARRGVNPSSCGNLNDPQKSYRLEFAIPREGILGDFGQLLQELGFTPRLALRRGLPTVYFRDSEEIADLMTLTGAGRLSLELMEVKILKEVRNRTNRMTNCDYANMDKTINAAAAQLEDIRRIYQQGGAESLPPDLRELAALRLENPEASLRDLGELMNPPLSRSGVNNRLRRIQAIAQGLLQGEKKKM